MTQISFHQKFIDFANILKSFIGCTYLSMPFAFYQSGLVLGIVMVISIALINDYTCVKIVKCKDLIIARLVEQFAKKQKSGLLPGPEVELLKSGVLKSRLEDRITLGHIAKYGFGKKGQWVVMICLFISQFGFCTGYIVFIGNTLFELRKFFLLPEKNSTIHNNTSSISDSVSDASNPVLIYLLFVPIPLFMLFSLLRTMRNIGWISIAANFIIAYGYCSIVGILITGFSLTDYRLADFENVAIMFGILTGAFEGIGTVIPIETSMIGNRHNFNLYLHVTIGIVIFVLGSFGILGSLKFGVHTSQIILKNLPPTVYLTIVNFILVISVIGTYPLQQFPNIEIIEFLFFRKRSAEFEQDRAQLLKSHESSLGQSEFDDVQREILAELSATRIDESDCLSINRRNENFPNYQTAINSDERSSELASTGGRHLDSVYTKTQMRMLRILYDSEIEAPAWRRNILRIVLVLSQLGLAILMRNQYAYLSAYIGLLGGSFLAYILPLAIEYKLTKYENDRLYIKLFNLFIVVFGTAGSISSLFFTTKEMIKSFQK